MMNYCHLLFYLSDNYGTIYLREFYSTNKEFEDAVLEGSHSLVPISMQREGWKIQSVKEIKVIQIADVKKIEEYISNPCWKVENIRQQNLEYNS